MKHTFLLDSNDPRQSELLKYILMAIIHSPNTIDD